MPLDLTLRTASTKDALEYREKRFPVSNNCFIPIVGVTGSGKTTIIINLFRLLNEIYRYSHIIYVAANYRQDATLRAACLTQIVLEDEVVFEQEREHTRHVSSMYPSGALLWFFGWRSASQKTTRGLQQGSVSPRGARLWF